LFSASSPPFNVAEYPSFYSLDAFNKSRELSSLQPVEWLPNVYASVLFPLPPEQGLPPNVIPYLEAVVSEYLPCVHFLPTNKHAVINAGVLTFHLDCNSILAGTFTLVLRALALQI
jgi:hypothetical protein